VPQPTRPTPIVLAYSGSVTTTLAIPWLAEQHGRDVVTLTLDVGQGQELEAVRDRALVAGAVRAHVVDAREEFARDYILPSLLADATDRSGHPLVAALALPLIAGKLVEIAAIEQASVVAHGGLGAGGATPLRAAIQTLKPALAVVTPPVGAFSTRGLGDGRVAVAASGRVAHVNLWGRAVAEPSGATAPDPGISATAAVEAAYVDVTFERGVPVGLNGVTLSFVDLITSLTTLARRHDIGRFVHEAVDAPDEFRRWRCEAPAAVALHLAHRELQSVVTAADLLALCDSLRTRYVDAVERGLWFAPVREAVQAFVGKVQERVTGGVRLKLLDGTCEVVSRQSTHATDIPAPAVTALVHH
jgi:argininosuccinate synthase